MKVDNIVIVANLGELKVYKAMPRDVEAELGLNPTNVKLDLIENKIYEESHTKLSEATSDQAGRFKGGSQGSGGSFTRGSIGDRHNIGTENETRVIKQIAEDITSEVKQHNTKWFLALPDAIYKRVFDEIPTDIKKDLVSSIEKDLMKENKVKIVDMF